MTDSIRIAVTGLGVVAPGGIGFRESLASLKAGLSYTRKIDAFDTHGFSSKVAAPIKGFKSSPDVPREISMAEIAVDQALSQSGVNCRELGMIYSTAVGSSRTLETKFRESRSAHSQDFKFDTAAMLLSAKFGIIGPKMTQTTGCTAGADALGMAVDLIQLGLCEKIIVVAAEAPITPIVVASFDRIGALSRANDTPRSASIPYHAKRDGFVISEGAAALVVERLQERDLDSGRILCELRGWASVCSAFHMTAIRQDGSDIENVLNQALSNAGTLIDDIDVLDMHATSTRQNDLAEARAINSVFGPRAKNIPVLAQKSINGHALGASNLIEIVNLIAASRDKIVAPSKYQNHQDSDCRVFQPTKIVEKHVRYAIKVSSGFSGIHTAHVLGFEY